MATYIDLTNELLRRLNEVVIDQNDFPAVRNIQALAKDAINSSIRKIIQSAQEWPFTLTTYSQTLTAGTREYDFPADMSSVDWDSFYIKQLASKSNQPQKLSVIPYTEYLFRYRPDDETGDEGSGIAIPFRVYQTQEEKFGVTPSPNDAYVVEYKYWTFPTSLNLYTDTAVIPDRFNHVIIDGAMMYMMRFRSNEQSAQIHQNDFDEGIKMMRRLLVDDKLFVRSTYKPRSTFNSYALRVVVDGG
jgi:hypothetical protein